MTALQDDAQYRIDEIASRFHEMLDDVSDDLDRVAARADDPHRVAALRGRQNALRVQIRMLRRSRSRALEDLEAGIALAIENLKGDVQELMKEGRKSQT